MNYFLFGWIFLLRKQSAGRRKSRCHDSSAKVSFPLHSMFPNLVVSNQVARINFGIALHSLYRKNVLIEIILFYITLS